MLNNIQFMTYFFLMVKKSEHKKITQKVKNHIKGGNIREVKTGVWNPGSSGTPAVDKNRAISIMNKAVKIIDTIFILKSNKVRS